MEARAKANELHSFVITREQVNAKLRPTVQVFGTIRNALQFPETGTNRNAPLGVQPYSVNELAITEEGEVTVRRVGLVRSSLAQNASGETIAVTASPSVTVPISCPAGSYNPSPPKQGALEFADCIPCPAGTSSRSMSARCFPCNSPIACPLGSPEPLTTRQTKLSSSQFLPSTRFSLLDKDKIYREVYIPLMAIFFVVCCCIFLSVVLIARRAHPPHLAERKGRPGATAQIERAVYVLEKLDRFRTLRRPAAGESVKNIPSALGGVFSITLYCAIMCISIAVVARDTADRYMITSNTYNGVLVDDVNYTFALRVEVMGLDIPSLCCSHQMITSHPPDSCSQEGAAQSTCVINWQLSLHPASPSDVSVQFMGARSHAIYWTISVPTYPGEDEENFYISRLIKAKDGTKLSSLVSNVAVLAKPTVLQPQDEDSEDKVWHGLVPYPIVPGVSSSVSASDYFSPDVSTGIRISYSVGDSRSASTQVLRFEEKFSPLQTVAYLSAVWSGCLVLATQIYFFANYVYHLVIKAKHNHAMTLPDPEDGVVRVFAPLARTWRYMGHPPPKLGQNKFDVSSTGSLVLKGWAPRKNAVEMDSVESVPPTAWAQVSTEQEGNGEHMGNGERGVAGHGEYVGNGEQVGNGEYVGNGDNGWFTIREDKSPGDTTDSHWEQPARNRTGVVRTELGDPWLYEHGGDKTVC